MKTKLTLLFFILLTISANITFAQWTQVGYMIGGTNDTATGGHRFKNFGSDVYCGTNKGLYRTSDDGTTWQSLTYGSAVITELDVNAVAVVANGDIYTGTNYRLYKSTNNGTSWSWITTLPDTTIINDITQMGSNLVVSWGTFTTGGVYYSSDNGISWNAATGLPNHRMMHFLTDGTTLYLGGYLGVYTSTDNGQSWSAAGTGFPTSNCSIFDVVKSSGAFFAGDVSGNGLYGSYDNCATWSAIDPSAFVNFCQVFSIAEANNVIIASMDGVCNTGGASPIKISNDTANSWNSYVGGLPQSFFPILGRNTSGSSFFTRKGSGKEVYKTGVSVNVSTINKENNSVELFPNPATNQITIKTNNNTPAEITIYDMLSRKIMQQTFTSNITLNIETLSKGIYSYKVKSINTIKNGKIIKN